MEDDFEPVAQTPASLAESIKRYRALAATPMTPEEAAIEAAKAAPQNQTGGAESFLSKAAESVPIIGAPYNKAVAALESLSPFFSSRHLEKGEGEYSPKKYEEALKGQEQLMEQRARENPISTTAGEMAGQVAGYAALPGASMATLPAAMATTAGISAADKAARGGTLRETLGAGAGGAAGGALGYGAGKVLSNTLGKLADWQGYRAMGGDTGTAYTKLSNIAGNLGLGPGGMAQMGREQGIIGGFKKLSDVSEAAGAAREKVGQQFGDLISRADETGSLIPVDDVLARVKDVATKGARKKYLGPAMDEAKSELMEAAGPGGRLTHGQLQDWLSERAAQASGISSSLAKGENVSAGDRAFHAVYKAGRDIQDRGLTEALGETGANAKELRRILALNSATEHVAHNREAMRAGQHPTGLIGAMGALEGMHQILNGNALPGAGILVASLAGKATQPYRANLLTTALSGGQGALNRLGAGEVAGLPAILGAKGGTKAAEVVSRWLKKEKPVEDDFEPVPPQVAKGGP